MLKLHPRQGWLRYHFYSIMANWEEGIRFLSRFSLSLKMEDDVMQPCCGLDNLLVRTVDIFAANARDFHNLRCCSMFSVNLRFH